MTPLGLRVEFLISSALSIQRKKNDASETPKTEDWILIHRYCDVFIGPPGCGKGTQSKRASESLGIPRLEMGQHFRDMQASTSDPRVLEKLAPLTTGGLVEDDFTVECAKRWLADMSERRQLILDGVIRTVPQFEELYPAIVGKGFKMRAIWFSTKLWECYKRLLAKPRPGRQDDVKDKILRRFVEYGRHTRHIKPRLADMGIETLSVDNTAISPEETWAAISSFIEKAEVAELSVA